MHRADAWVDQRAEPQTRELVRPRQTDDQPLRTLDAHGLSYVQRIEDTHIEGRRGVDVADLECDVVEHRSTVAAASAGEAVTS